MSHLLLSARLRRLAVCAAIGLAGGASAWAQPHGPHGMGGFMFGERALDAVNATDAQRTQIKQIMQSAMTDLRAQHEGGRELRQQMVQLFTQPTVDANAAEALRQRMLAQHDATSRRMMQAMLEVSRVLTPEQRASLAEQMQKRHERMMQRHENKN